jgi:hypothetical protein
VFGFFKKYDAHLCSAVSGRILENGKPVADLKIERILVDFDSKERKDSTITDQNGAFTLPAVNIRSRSPGSLFRELLTKQKIYLKKQDELFTLWSTTLWGVEPIAAYDRKLSQLNADLKNPLVFFQFKNDYVSHVKHGARSICRWDTDFEIHHIIEDETI